MSRVPSEIPFDSVYFPPFLFTVVLGLAATFAVTWMLNLTGWSRFFWHPGLAFLALWVLFTSLTGLYYLPP